MNKNELMLEHFNDLMEKVSDCVKELYGQVPKEDVINFCATLSKELLAITIAMIIKGTTVLQSHHEDIQLIVTSAIERAIELKQRLEDEY